MATKQPRETRQRILDAAFWEVYRNGFQGASIDRILDGTGITKGALFHHFSTKLHLGYAVVEGPVRAWVNDHWIAPLEAPGDAIRSIPEQIRAFLDRSPEEVIHGGCPFANLAQEMSGIDEGFRLRLEAVATDWRAALAGLWRRGQAEGHVKPDLDADDMAAFTLAAILGVLATAKTAKSRDLAGRSTAVFARVLEGLRP